MSKRSDSSKRPDKSRDDISPVLDLEVKNAYELSAIDFEKLAVGECMGYVYIAVHWGEFWCAYRGLWGTSAKELRDWGDPIDREVALKIFPMMVYCRLPYGN